MKKIKSPVRICVSVIIFVFEVDSTNHILIMMKVQ